MKNRLMRNWGLKLASFLVAVILWLIITNINDPVVTFRAYNVPVKIENADLITNNGQVYEVLDNTDVIGTVTVSAKRSIIDSLSESNIVAVADMNDLTRLNTINIRLSTNKYSDKLESIKGSIDSVKLNIENERTKTLQLKTETTGTVKEGYMVGDITTEQNLIAISGPESVVSQVKRAVASVDVSGFTNNIGTDTEIRLYDENDRLITASSIVKNISKVRVTVEILEMKSVPLSLRATGVPARGYIATGEITATRDSVVIAGKTKTISDIDSIEIPESVLDITGASESLETIIDLHDYLPDGVILAEEGFEGKVQVNVVVEAVGERVVAIDARRIQVQNMPAEFEYEIIEDEERALDVTLVGLSRDLEALDVNALQASVDIAALMEGQEMEEMIAGTYTVPLVINLEGTNITIKDDVSIRLDVTKRED